jgi:hypothetical protein
MILKKLFQNPPSGAQSPLPAKNLNLFRDFGERAYSFRFHNGTSASVDADFVVGCEQVFARIFGRLLRVRRNCLCNVKADGSGSLQGAKSNGKKHSALRNGNRGLLRGRHIR